MFIVSTLGGGTTKLNQRKVPDKTLESPPNLRGVQLV